MGTKAERKRKLIREKARGIFGEKGFKRVTMKDIIDACGISRGGLYLYYGSTEEVFLDVLRMEQEEADDVFAASIPENASPARILEVFLSAQKKELLEYGSVMSQATWEFASMPEGESVRRMLREQYGQALSVVEHLIGEGNASGEFECPDPHSAACIIMRAMEGLRISAVTMDMDEKSVDREIQYLFEVLLKS